MGGRCARTGMKGWDGMPTRQRDTDIAPEDYGGTQFLIDLPGFALIREGSALTYSWVPAVCSAEIVDGLLSTLGLQVDEVWAPNNGIVFASVVGREEMNAEN